MGPPKEGSLDTDTGQEHGRHSLRGGDRTYLRFMRETNNATVAAILVVAAVKQGALGVTWRSRARRRTFLRERYERVRAQVVVLLRVVRLGRAKERLHLHSY
jgi:hypothetical protein